MKKVMFQDIEEKVEGKIIDWISTSSNSQVICFRPEGNLAGVVDLVVKGRAEYESAEEMYLQLQECKKDGIKGFFYDEIPIELEKEGKNLFFLFTFFDIVTQDIFDYVWLIPTEKFFDVAEKTKEGRFVFKAPIDVTKNHEYSRYLIGKKNLGRILSEMLTQGSRFYFPPSGFSGFYQLDINKLKEFLIEARRNTFAGTGTPVDNPRLKGSKEFGFQKGDWAYQDIYFSGKDNLLGQEVIYYNNNPVWAMNYFADQMPEGTTEFLKYALSRLADQCRMGGNCNLDKKGYSYSDKGEGALEKFSGLEVVKGKNEYKFYYQGGLIAK